MIYNCFILFLRMLCDTILVSTNALCEWTGGRGRCGQWMRKSFRRGKGKKSTGPLSASSLIFRQITYTMICSGLSKQEYRLNSQNMCIVLKKSDNMTKQRIKCFFTGTTLWIGWHPSLIVHPKKPQIIRCINKSHRSSVKPFTNV